MDTGTIIALSFGGGAVFGFILAIISICIDRRCGRKKGSLFADEGSPKGRFLFGRLFLSNSQYHFPRFVKFSLL